MLDVGLGASQFRWRRRGQLCPPAIFRLLWWRGRELFPGPSKATTTRAYLHAEADVERALNEVGWKIRKRGLITMQFYFARLVEAVPA
ncbi:hypothetical protein SLE2022_021320 [Rubroshorea leprosula]